jgi:transcription elongation factor Elf1
MSNCPKCEKLVSNVSISDATGFVGMQSKWKGIALSCMSCGTVLSVQIDPIAIKSDTLQELAALLRK